MFGAKQRALAVFLILIVCASVTWSQDLYITEFMAVRSVSVVDDDGDDNDFIEIYNNGLSTESLEGYYLSDDCANPFKWSFPAGVEIGPDEFLVIWASEKDRTNPCCALHTNFRLDGDGECLLLSDADGELIHGYSPYPNQQLGYTYGLEMNGSGGGGGLVSLVAPGASCTVTVPPSTNPSADLDWSLSDFNDSSWTSGTTGVGYDTTPDYHPLINLDVETAMRHNNMTCYIRIPFQVDHPASTTLVDFAMKYDDGFIAYINGTRVASRNAPNSPTSTSGSTTDQADASAFNFEVFDFSEGTPTLVGGENILAIHALNWTIDSSDLLAVPRLEARVVSGGNSGELQSDSRQYFSEPSPGFGNVPGLPGISERPLYSDPTGAYPIGLSVTLSMEIEVPGTEIRYTLDESVPTESSTLYTGPVDIEGELVMAARAFQPGLQPSKPIYRHYLIVDRDLEDFNSSIPVVVCSMLQRSLPGASFSTCGNGAYVDGRFFTINPGDDGRAWLVDPVDFEHAAGYRKRGNPDFSCGRPKFFFNVEFRDREGKDDDEIPYDGFAPHSDFAMWGPWEFDRTFMRNPIAYWMSREAGQWAAHTQFVECFLRNPGRTRLSMTDYWGVYVFMERNERGVGRIDVERLDARDNAEPDVTGGYILKRDHREDAFTAGGYPNVVFSYPGNPTSQQRSYIVGFLNQAVASLRTGIGSQEDNNLIDFQAFLDHHIINWFTKNADAFRVSGYFYKARGGPLVMGPVWDFDRSMGCAVDPRAVTPTGYHNDPEWDGGSRFFEDPGPAGVGGFLGSWYGRLFGDQPPTENRNTAWNRAYRQRWRELRGGPLSTTNITEQIEAWADVLEEPAARNLQRWPQNPPRFGGYLGEVNHLKDWLITRAEWIDDEFGQVVEAPTFSHPGGTVEEGTPVTLSALDGTIYYTVNGPDPRGANGAPHPQAELYDGPIPITGNTRILARARVGGDWSELVESGYVTEEVVIVVTEIMYNPRFVSNDSFGKSLYEFIEIYNPGSEVVHLSGVSLEDPFFDFTGSGISTLGPGEYAVVVRNVDAFLERYGGDGILIAGAFSGALSNTAQDLRLVGPSSESILHFDYQDSWEPTTDGAGHSLVIQNPQAARSTWSLASSWRASAEVDGSPGRADTVVALRVQGDLSGDGFLGLVDVVALLFNLFDPESSGVEPCDSEAGNRELQDTDGDGVLTVNDALRLLRFLYVAGPPPDKGSDCTVIEGCPAACF